MKRSLDHHHVDIRCTNGHPGESMGPAGFYALKEAGAPFTIIAFRCGRCHREVFVNRAGAVRAPLARDATRDRRDAMTRRGECGGRVIAGGAPSFCPLLECEACASVISRGHHEQQSH